METLPTRKSHRLWTHLYNNGWFFVTLCTQDKKCDFWIVNESKTLLSRQGEIAEKYWLSISDVYPTVELMEYMIMPNHLHGILFIHDVVGAVVGAATSRPEYETINQLSKKSRDTNELFQKKYINSDILIFSDKSDSMIISSEMNKTSEEFRNILSTILTNEKMTTITYNVSGGW